MNLTIDNIDLNKLTKTEILIKCEELGITKYKSKNKKELVQLIDNVVRLQVNLTNSPYRDTSINTVSSEDTSNTATN